MHGSLATNPLSGILEPIKYIPGKRPFGLGSYQCGNCDFIVNLQPKLNGWHIGRLQLEKHLRTHVPASVLAIIDANDEVTVEREYEINYDVEDDK